MVEPELAVLENQLNLLADHLKARRDALLDEWRDLADKDSLLAAASHLSRAQFVDHVPPLLDALDKNLRQAATFDRASSESDRQNARDHGLHRWQQGYDLLEVTREWSHLHFVLNDEIEAVRQAASINNARVIFLAQREVTEIIHECVAQSVTQFQKTRESEAISHLRDLERANTQLGELERARGEVLRAASHDLRSGLTVVQGATELLRRPDELSLDPENQEVVLDLLQRSVVSLRHMMGDLLNLARLEARQEVVEPTEFDAAQLLRESCETALPLAQSRGLFLHFDGPTTLQVQTDRTKVARIAQNLLLNALRYTLKGGVTVCWAEEIQDHWSLTIQDTGPGLDSGSAAPSDTPSQSDTLQKATLLQNQSEPEYAQLAPENPADRPANEAEDGLIGGPGEGIGLTIVKRLCGLLQGRLELESHAHQGTTFRIVFPRHLPTPPATA